MEPEYEPLVATPGVRADSFSVQSSKRWSNDFCACGGDIRIFCAGLWCPCWVFGQSSQQLVEEGAGGGSALRNCCLFFTIPEAVNLSLYALAVGLGAGAVHPTTPVAVQLVATYARVFLASATLATFAHRRRGEVRRLEGIPGAAWKDWCLYFWFPGCAVCQEAAELKQRKEARLQAAGGDYHVAVEPPKEQRMA